MAHLCRGSAGTYNIAEPEDRRFAWPRKTAALEARAPDVIATGDLGCAVQIGFA